MPRLTDYRVLTFDCYGTLIDWEGGIWDALQPLILRNPGSSATRDAGLRAFAQGESRQEQATPGLRYPELLARVHLRIAESLGLQTDDELDAAFGASMPHWPAFPDTADALRILKRHYKLVILSNVHRRRHRRLEPQAWGRARRHLHRRGHRLLQAVRRQLRVPAGPPAVGSGAGAVGGAAHGAEPAPRPWTANRFGLANAWIDRQRLSEGGSWGATERVEKMPSTDFVFFSNGRDGGSRGGRLRRRVSRSAAAAISGDLHETPPERVPGARADLRTR